MVGTYAYAADFRNHVAPTWRDYNVKPRGLEVAKKMSMAQKRNPRTRLYRANFEPRLCPRKQVGNGCQWRQRPQPFV